MKPHWTLACLLLFTACIIMPAFSQPDSPLVPISRHLLLSPGANNPRNSEGDFLGLQNGRLLFIYTHFTGGSDDDAPAHLASRISEDQGLTWSKEDQVVLPNEGGMNVMSVSLLRLASGKIALFYLRKNSTKDCLPFLRLSLDECQTWSNPVSIVPENQAGYYVLNNDRVVELLSGRILVPLAMHSGEGLPEWNPSAHILCYYSDDQGSTWHRSRSVLTASDINAPNLELQEPGVVQRSDGELLMFIRTNGGCQYFSHSLDEGNTWSAVEPSTLKSPLSPASIKRIPGTDDLLAVWNDHESIPPARANRRTPLVAARSRDGGKTWINKRTLESDKNGWYCYTAIEFLGERVFLAYCAGSGDTEGLNQTQISSFSPRILFVEEH